MSVSRTTSRRPTLLDKIASSDAAFAGVRQQLRFRYIPLDQIRPSPNNPRQHFAEAQLEDLAQSIRAVGVIQPISVRPVGDDAFEIIAGGRRYEAAKRAERRDIPAVIRDDEAAAAVSLIENLQRENLNAIEEAMALQHLLDAEELSRTDLSLRIGRSPAYVSQVLGLLELDDEIKQAVLSGASATKTQLRELIGLPAERQRELFRMILSGSTVKELQKARVERIRRPRGTTSLFEVTERHLRKIEPEIDSMSGTERHVLRKELERLKEAITAILNRVPQ
jgi:ParB family transcriptional regulator, chromosome partitioning protein